MNKAVRLALILMVLPAHSPAAREFYAWAGADYYEGTYGGRVPVRTTYLYVNPVWSFASMRISVYIPYLLLDYPADASLRQARPGRVVGNSDEREAGIGDITATAWYEVPAEAANVLIGGSIKLPTAEEPSLGTGRADYSLMLDVTRPLGQANLSAGIAYTFYGEPADYDLQETFSGYVGAEWYGAAGFVGASFYAEEAWERGAAGARELSVYLGDEFGSRTVWLSFTRVFTEASPDWGVGIGFRVF